VLLEVAHQRERLVVEWYYPGNASAAASLLVQGVRPISLALQAELDHDGAADSDHVARRHREAPGR
jgi:hypothetical protein